MSDEKKAIQRKGAKERNKAQRDHSILTVGRSFLTGRVFFNAEAQRSRRGAKKPLETEGG